MVLGLGNRMLSVVGGGGGGHVWSVADSEWSFKVEMQSRLNIPLKTISNG